MLSRVIVLLVCRVVLPVLLYRFVLLVPLGTTWLRIVPAILSAQLVTTLPQHYVLNVSPPVLLAIYQAVFLVPTLLFTCRDKNAYLLVLLQSTPTIIQCFAKPVSLLVLTARGQTLVFLV